MGLSTVAAIVKKPRRVCERLQNRVGNGTTFKVYLPAMEFPSRASKEQSQDVLPAREWRNGPHRR